MSFHHDVVLQRFGPADAAAALVSLPLSRELAGQLHVDHPHSSQVSLAWWERNKLPRRSLAAVIDPDGGPVPDSLRLTTDPRPAASFVSPWQVRARVTREKLDYTPHSFPDIPSLRGVPAHECTTVEGELLLAYRGRTLSLQLAADGPKSGPFVWQNVQVDPLWQTAAAQAVRVGGIIFNEDTYLWADVYLILFTNGVAQVAAHFVNTKLHIEGYDFVGLPSIRFAGEGLQSIETTVPEGGLRHDLGLVKLGLDDAAILCSQQHPGTLRTVDGAVWWNPFDQVFNPQKADNPERYWPHGFARSVRFCLSMSQAAPAVARYRVPSWWYTQASEPWPGGALPVEGRWGPVGSITSNWIRQKMSRGRFDGGSGEFANDGDAGVGMMSNFYFTGDSDLFQDALHYCYYWADIAVDHRDFTVHQWVGGWGWKTCAYTKFRDVLYGYLETGDPYLKDTVEMVAEAYWVWFRTNWPRSTIGRDNFEVGGWALLWRFLRTEHSRERTLELVRMNRTVLQSRGQIGGQMGAGPHPGYISSLYMTGVTMISLMEVAEAMLEEGQTQMLREIEPMLAQLEERWSSDDVELFPSNFGNKRADWTPNTHVIWTVMSGRIYAVLARLAPALADRALVGLRRSIDNPKLPPIAEWAPISRPGQNLINPLYFDALSLNATLQADGVELSPLLDIAHWPAQQQVHTPWGPLTLTVSLDDGAANVKLQADRDFPVTLHLNGKTYRSSSQRGFALPTETASTRA